MDNHARAMGASFIILSLIVSPAAFAAAEDPAPEKPAAQAQPDDRSYLPPWMQGQGGAENANAPGNGAAEPSQRSAAVEGGAAKKAKIVSQGQRPRRHGSRGEGLFGGFAGLFGR